MEKYFLMDCRGRDFACCLYPIDEDLLVCVARLLICLGPVLDHGLGVGDPCYIAHIKLLHFIETSQLEIKI